MGYKVCPSCGTRNPEDDIVCKECMADLTGVEPVDEEVEEGANREPEEEIEERTVVISDTLTLLGDGFSIVVKSGDVVGRQGIGAESLRGFKTVSRRHARFYKKGDKWLVEDVGSTNGTFVNDKPVPQGSGQEIKNGDVIKLSSQVALKVKV